MRTSFILSLTFVQLHISRMHKKNRKVAVEFIGSMTYYHTGGDIMASSKIAITIEDNLLKRIDNLVKNHAFPNRSRAIQEAVREKLARIDKTRLARECSKLDPKFEHALAEEGFTKELDEWPEY